jgi:hypothetical protein
MSEVAMGKTYLQQSPHFSEKDMKPQRGFTKVTQVFKDKAMA